ncbi:hypothetical protein AVEN_49510-1 [Araneus ventricosus]|uniref:Uncharacterized protein n=1 Tax=Araneus ventricosus TaxID=182803 RepID=A0A4Y2PZ64_ARAVE|nr:hypothetical protein AVEN_49510-1 [Araneus ventricosus]
MFEDEKNELTIRLSVLSELKSINDKFVYYWNHIEYSRRHMIEYIDDLSNNLTIIVPGYLDRPEIEDVLTYIKTICNRSVHNLTTCLTGSLRNYKKLYEKINDFDTDSIYAWWTLASHGNSYKDKFQTFHLEFRRVQQLFDEMIKRYSEMYAF